MKTIKAFFNRKTGETRVEADGFYGSECKEATKFLEALGEQRVKLKDEFYLLNPNVHQESTVRNVDA